MEKVSVIVPVYNAEKTLRACVDSILRQTLREIKVILVDDGSTDASPALCDALAREEARVEVFHQSNQGQSRARWRGVEAARTEWVTFVDSDDTLIPTALADLYDCVSADTDVVLGNGNSLGDEHRRQIPIEDFRHLAVEGRGQIGLVWGCLYRRSALSFYCFDIPVDIRMGEDYIFWLRLAFQTRRPVAVLYKDVYRKGADTITRHFVWTADFARRIHELRKASIPADQHSLYMSEMVSDRMVNLFGVALVRPRSEWQGSPFYQELMADIRRAGIRLPVKHRLYLALPSRTLRRGYSMVSNFISSFCAFLADTR